MKTELPRYGSSTSAHNVHGRTSVRRGFKRGSGGGERGGGEDGGVWYSRAAELLLNVD